MKSTIQQFPPLLLNYPIRGGNDLLPKAFATRLSEKIQYNTQVVRIEQDTKQVRVIFDRAEQHHALTADLICAILFSVQRNMNAPQFGSTAGCKGPSNQAIGLREK